MPRPTLALLALSLLLAAGAVQDIPTEKHPSLTSEVLATFAPQASGADGAARAQAAVAFLEALTPERRAQAKHARDSAEQRKWTNVPPQGDEAGVRLGDCTRAELEAACGLLATVLSEAGYAQVRDIVLADDRLLTNGQPRRGFGAENFWLLIFGEPHAEEPWALQLDGHHLALNLQFEGDAMGFSPSFLGAQPASFPRKGQTIEPLAAEVRAAHAFLTSLTQEQRVEAVIGDRRRGNAAGAGRDGQVPEPQGMLCGRLTEAQLGHLRGLVSAYLDFLPEPVATARLEHFASDFKRTRFAWWGPTDHPADVSFRVQGPELLLEFACQDLGGDPLQHLHAMLRDFSAEYTAPR